MCMIIKYLFDKTALRTAFLQLAACDARLSEVQIKETCLPEIRSTGAYAAAKAAVPELYVLVTDHHQAAAAYRAAGGCVVGVDERAEEDWQQASFPEADAVVTDIQALTEAFIRMTACHHYRLPFTVERTKRLRIRESIPEDYEVISSMLSACSPDAFSGEMKADEMAEKEQFCAYTHTAYHFFGFGLWTIERLADHAVIGWCGLMPAEDEQVLQLGYLTGSLHRRQGYALEACRAVCRYARQELGVEKIGLTAAPDNTGSRNLAVRLGFTEYEHTQEQIKYLLIFDEE